MCHLILQSVYLTILLHNIVLSYSIVAPLRAILHALVVVALSMAMALFPYLVDCWDVMMASLRLGWSQTSDTRRYENGL